MITLDVKPYCQSCLDFEPDVEKPEKLYGESPNGESIEYIISDTVIRCRYRKRCEAIKRYLDKQKEKDKD